MVKLFYASFWIAAILSLLSALLNIKKEIFRSKNDEDKIPFKNIWSYIHTFYQKTLMTYALIVMSFPISIIDYSKPCVEYDSGFSLMIMEGLIIYPLCTFVALPLVIYDMVLVYYDQEINIYVQIINWGVKTEKQGFRNRCLAELLLWTPFTYIIINGCFLLISSLIISSTRLLGGILTINAVLSSLTQ